jgi:molecular chaperone DnaK
LAEIEARNQLDNRVYQTEKLLRENREKLPEGDAKTVEEALEKAKSALAGGNLESIEAANKELETASHKVAEVLYSSAKAPGAGGAGTPPGAGGGAGAGGPEPKKPGDGDVIDAEFVDVDDSKQPN